ncbi:hypothetical protein [Bradyrhizobium sp. 142]|uniref:hypothetical protein n=1 Tax=Bradyrhizobium sp. 142 TaxID=2782618 RepID=UPI001FFBA576|nr:hypothetical protein [Bradyrhizobium sp. 142]
MVGPRTASTWTIQPEPRRARIVLIWRETSLRSAFVELSESGPAKYQPAISEPSFKSTIPFATSPAYGTRSAKDGPE